MKSEPIYSDFVYVERPPRKPAPVININSKRRKLLAFHWYGGKFSHLDWLLPLLPVEGVHHYCEPFGGSAAVLLNRPPSPIETYNDFDGEVVNFFRVLREQRDELLYALHLTPFSREEFYLACSPPEEDISDLERARRFFIRAGQVRTGLAQTATLGRWANCKSTSRSTFRTKISPSSVDDYLFFFTDAPPNGNAVLAAKQYFAQGHHIGFLSVKDWSVNILGTIGPEGRSHFMNIITIPHRESPPFQGWDERRASWLRLLDMVQRTKSTLRTRKESN